MDKIEISDDKMRALLQDVVDEKGADFVYDRGDISSHEVKACLYAEYDGCTPVGPGCLVGHVLVRAGVPVEMLGVLDKAEDGDSAGADDAVPVVANVSERALRGLLGAQVRQDSGDSWGDALGAYDEIVADET